MNLFKMYDTASLEFNSTSNYFFLKTEFFVEFENWNVPWEFKYIFPQIKMYLNVAPNLNYFAYSIKTNNNCTHSINTMDNTDT